MVNSVGTQFPVEDYTRKYGLGVDIPILSEILGSFGYVSHAVGQVSENPSS